MRLRLGRLRQGTATEQSPALSSHETVAACHLQPVSRPRKYEIHSLKIGKTVFQFTVCEEKVFSTLGSSWP